VQSEVVIAGAGIAGLLLASELALSFHVVVVERRPALPGNKYWLTDDDSLRSASDLAGCVATRCPSLDFIAYDGSAARVQGPYLQWDTERLVTELARRATASGATLLFSHPFLTCAWTSSHVEIRAGGATIKTKLLVDCMGYESPVVAAKRTVDFLGFFVLAGRRVRLRSPVAAVGLHNTLLQREPSYLELLPNGDGTANLTMIAPARSLRDRRSLARDLTDSLLLSPYRDVIERDTQATGTSLFGVVPVGIARTHNLNRVFFYGEAGQVNPAASATGLSRMLRTYRQVADYLGDCIRTDALGSASLQPSGLRYMSRLHRLFQESLFRGLLTYTSDDFRKLVHELARLDDSTVNGFLFASLPINERPLTLIGTMMQSRGILAAHMLRALAAYPLAYGWLSPRR
jgi:flavin-dependent dehydrogenase